MKSTITVQTSEARHRELKAYAGARGRTLRDVVETAIDRLLETDSVQVDEKIVKADWDNSPAVQSEFGKLEFYLAYRRAVAAGATRELKPRESQNGRP